MNTGIILAWFLIPLIAVIVMLVNYYRNGKGVSEKQIDDEYIRWKDWAGTLLLVMTVLLAFDASLLGNYDNKAFVLLGGVAGFMGIFLVAMWFTREGFWEYKGKPVLLRVGTGLLGFQAVLFLLSFLIKQLN
jgi:hypothetical protein